MGGTHIPFKTVPPYGGGGFFIQEWDDEPEYRLVAPAKVLFEPRKDGRELGIFLSPIESVTP